jgi:hypothetical protein
VPGQPTLTATGGVGQVNLSWTTPSNGGSQISGYNVYRGPTAGNLSIYQSLGVVTTYADAGVVPGVTYFYAVAARNAVGVGPSSAVQAAIPIGVPSAPLNPSAAPDSKKGIDLAWSAPASNGGSAITGYQILRGTSPGTEMPLTTVAASALTYRDTTTVRNRTYFYVIRAVNGVGPGPVSSEVSAIAR